MAKFLESPSKFTYSILSFRFLGFKLIDFKLNVIMLFHSFSSVKDDMIYLNNLNSFIRRLNFIRNAIKNTRFRPIVRNPDPVCF